MFLHIVTDIQYAFIIQLFTRQHSSSASLHHFLLPFISVILLIIHHTHRTRPSTAPLRLPLAGWVVFHSGSAPLSLAVVWVTRREASSSFSAIRVHLPYIHLCLQRYGRDAGRRKRSCATADTCSYSCPAVDTFWTVSRGPCTIAELHVVVDSTISSGLNSLSAVCLQDLLRLFCSKDMSEKRATLASKLICMYCTSFVVVAYFMSLHARSVILCTKLWFSW